MTKKVLLMPAEDYCDFHDIETEDAYDLCKAEGDEVCDSCGNYFSENEDIYATPSALKFLCTGCVAVVEMDELVEAWRKIHENTGDL